MIVEGKVYIVIEKNNLDNPVYEVFGRQSDFSVWYIDNFSGCTEDYNERFETEIRTVNFSVNVEINQW